MTDWVRLAQDAVKPEGGPLPDEVQALALVAIATELRVIREVLERMAPPTDPMAATRAAFPDLDWEKIEREMGDGPTSP